MSWQKHLCKMWHHCQCYPFEPGFEGHITIEISNTTPLPAKIYANEGIAQVLFCKAMKNVTPLIKIKRQVSSPNWHNLAKNFKIGTLIALILKNLSKGRQNV